MWPWDEKFLETNVGRDCRFFYVKRSFLDASYCSVIRDFKEDLEDQILSQIDWLDLTQRFDEFSDMLSDVQIILNNAAR